MSLPHHTEPPLPRSFFEHDVPAIASSLLGKILWRETMDGLLAGRIVETEAYLSVGDSACHAAGGPTKKNASMFGPPGHAYVYPIHAKYCFNIVTEAAGVGSAVLIRAVEPIVGVDAMRQRRNVQRLRDITSGPAKLCQAMQIDRDMDGWDMTRGIGLWVSAQGALSLRPREIGHSERIGVTSAEHLKLRFYVRGNEFVSGTKRLRA